MTIDISKLPSWAKLELSKEDLEAFAHLILLNSKSVESKSVEPTTKILWIDDAAKLLNLAKPTIYGLLSKGRLPHYKRGRKVYFLRSELEAWLLTGKQSTIADESAKMESYLSSKKRKL